MKIIVDAYGGDRSPDEIVAGAIDAVGEKEGFDVVLVGRSDGINSVLAAEEYDKSRVSVVGADEVITNEEAPTEAIRRKKNSSVVVGLKLLKDDEHAAAFVSAGATGAVLTGAVLLTKRIKGVMRPALAPLLPNLKGGETMLLDCGASVDLKAANLLQFAVMGSAYMREVKGIENPKVALLSNGTEDKKGCALTHEAFPLLKEKEGLNFVGNMEARDILSGEYDVVVSDGFYGNIALKSIEGAVGAIFTSLKREVRSSKKAALGALLMKGAFRNLKSTLDYNKKGGAMLLGLEKVVIKAHGASGREAIKNAVLQAYSVSSVNVTKEIADALSECDAEEKQ